MRGDKCLTCGTYLDDLGYCPNADLHSLWLIQRAARELHEFEASTMSRPPIIRTALNRWRRR